MDVLIENTEARMYGIPKPIGDKIVAGALIQPISITLLPGLNVVDADAWTEAKLHKMVVKHIEEGSFKELKEVGSLTSLSPTQAEKYVDICFDVKMLAGWNAQEKRTKVKKILEARLEKLEKPEPGTQPNAKINMGGKARE